MPVITKGRLKAVMLEAFRRVEESGEELVVTDRGRPVLKVVPYAPPKPASLVFGDLRAVYHGDLLEPTVDEWEET
jgi:antitoxin (DNA-binding transcriptional repressor) of toxin-antitoxin stability system